MSEVKEEKEETKKIKNRKFDINPEAMLRAGLSFGHRTSRTHPKMRDYICGTKNDIHIIDIEKSAKKFEEALDFIKKLISENKTFLFVGTKIQIRNLVKDIAVEVGLPYINDRWLGGTFTNFNTIKKRVDYFKELKRKKETGELEKYTKKERAKIDKELKKLEIKFGGIKELEKLPDAIFVLDMKKDLLAVKEAIKKRIPVIGIADTNIDPSLADYPIPANDDAVPSLKYILEKIKEVILSAKLKVQNSKPQLKTES